MPHPRPALVGGVIAAGLALLPLAFILQQVQQVGWDDARRLLLRPRVGQLLLDTGRLTVTVTALCMVVGLAAAWATERTGMPLRRTLSVLLALPLAVPEYVNGFGWVSLVPGMHGFWAAVLVMTLSHYPLVYLPSAAMLRTGDPALEEASRTLGRGPWSTFTSVTVPQVRIAVVGGGLVIALHLLAEYGGFAILRYRTLATEIYSTYKLGFDPASASLLSLVLVVMCIVILGGEWRLRGPSSGARAGAATARRRRLARLGPWTALPFAGCVALIVLALGVPVWSLVHWLVVGGSTTLPPASIVGATTTTMTYGVLAAAITCALALPVAFLSARRGGKGAVVLERAVFVPRALPGLVVGLSLVYFTVRYAYGLYQSPALLVAAYSILFLPLALIAIEPVVAQLTPALEDAARTLGSGPLMTLRRVTLPLLVPGLGAAAALVFLTCVTELTATLLLRPTGTETLATQFWVYADGLAYGAAAPFAAMMVGLSLVPTLLLARRFHALPV